MAFGMRNAPATFQRLMNLALSEMKNCNMYLDDVVVYSKVCEDHLASLHTVFQRLATASLTLNLAKCEVGKAMVTYLRKQVGLDQGAKVEALVTYPASTTQRELRHFLEMAGCYHCFSRNFSVVAAP